MEFCSILPIKNMDLMFKQPKMVMLLAHLAMKYPDYAKAAKEYKGYKILDNSIIELGSAFDMWQLKAAAESVQADEIILPDEFQNGPKSVEMAKEAIRWLKDMGMVGKYRLMAVAHGKTPEEVKRSIDAYGKLAEIDTIGIPKIISTRHMDRISMADYARNTTGKDIHLLGCYYSLFEYCNRDLSNIRSTDTCLPALLAINGIGPLDQRMGLTIDLEHDEVNPTAYRYVMERFYADSGI